MLNPLLVTLFVIVVITPNIKTQSTVNPNLDTSRIIVEFNPYVSPLDSFDQTRYNVADLLPLISKVATRFSKIFIRIDTTSFFVGRISGMSLAPFAIAKHNCLPSTTKKIEVLLALYVSNEYVCVCELIRRLAVNATSLANEVNQECSGTVTTIFLPEANCMYSENRRCKLETQVSEVYKWGLIVSCGNQPNKQQYPNNFLNPDIVAFEYYNEHGNWTDCVTYPKNQTKLNTQFAKIFGISDTGVDNVVNTSRMVGSLTKFFSDKTYIPILNKAFDTYEWLKWKHIEPIHTNGWWYLDKDSPTSNTSEYSFVEKIAASSKIDYEEDPKNFEWLRSDEHLNKSLIGITCHGKVSIDTSIKDFDRILVQDSVTLVKTVKWFVDNFAKLKHNRIKRNVNLVIQMHGISAQDLSSILQIKDNVTIIIPVHVTGNSASFNETLMELCKEMGIKYGYSIIYGICPMFSKLHANLKNTINQTMSDPDRSIFVFDFPNNRNMVNLGAYRRFRYMKSWLEPCINFVQKYQADEKEILFTMSNYYKNNQFYQSLWAMQHFVKYVYLLQQWASKLNNVMVLIEDETDFVNKTGFPSQTVGWYFRDEFTGEYVRVKDVALKMSMLHYPNSNIETSYTSKNNIIMISVFVFGAFIVSTLVVSIYFIKRFRKKYYLSKNELETFFNGENASKKSGEISFYNVPYDKSRFEIDESKFSVSSGAPLGIGEFGQVCQGTLIATSGEISVAIKMTKPENTSKQYLQSMLAEIKIMSYIGNHANIVKFLGACTASLKARKIYIFVELCGLGSLEKNLREIHSLICSKRFETISGANVADSLELSQYEELYRWSTEICCGMAYLAEKFVVHADLATRNVLLGLDRTAKICDFGLSRRMYNYSNYVKTGQEPLPWKWMAPESLNCNIFNEKSDVWAFGVTLWEIYSLGTSPYPGLSWEANFVNKLERGLILPEPLYNKKNMYELMKKCWSTQPENRPTFSQMYFLLSAQCSNDLSDYTTLT